MGHKYFNSHILFIFLVSFLFSYFAAFKCILFRWRLLLHHNCISYRTSRRNGIIICEKIGLKTRKQNKRLHGLNYSTHNNTINHVCSYHKTIEQLPWAWNVPDLVKIFSTSTSSVQSKNIPSFRRLVNLNILSLLIRLLALIHVKVSRFLNLNNKSCVCSVIYDNINRDACQ